MIDVELDPSPDRLIKELRGLSEDLQLKAVDAGLITAMKPVKAAMKASAPRGEYGNIEKAIGHVNLSKRAKARLGIDVAARAKLVGPTRKVAINDSKIHLGRLANMLEQGTKPHQIKFKNKKRLRLAGGGFASVVNHPGITATYFMANALAMHQSRIQGLFYQGLAKHLDKRRKT